MRQSIFVISSIYDITMTNAIDKSSLYFHIQILYNTDITMVRDTKPRHHAPINVKIGGGVPQGHTRGFLTEKILAVNNPHLHH